MTIFLPNVLASAARMCAHALSRFRAQAENVRGYLERIFMPNPMNKLYLRLNGVGFPRAYVREKVLPDWWRDEIAAAPSGFAEGAGYVARHLGLDLRSLREEAGLPRFVEHAAPKLKKSRSARHGDLRVAISVATQVAKIAASGARGLPGLAKGSALAIRKSILSSGKPWVDLASLIDFCWSAGIVVLHVSLPSGARRMDGMAARVGGRPVIVVSKQRKSPAWLLFILAHELGHVMLGHIDSGQTIVDEEIDEADTDAEETTANSFAIELLNGSNRSFFVDDKWLNAPELATAAMAKGGELNVDPGHVALNYAHTMNKRSRKSSFFATATAALSLLEKDKDGRTMFGLAMESHLSWDDISAESGDFLRRATGADGEA